MEASQAFAANGGQGGSDAGQAAGDDAQQQAAQQAQQQGQQFDPGMFADALGQLAGSHEQLREYLMSQNQPEGEPEPQVPELDPQWLDMTDPSFDPDQLAQRLQGHFDQTASAREQALLDRIDTLESRYSEDQRRVEAERLVEEFEELADPQVANQVVGLARQLVEANNWPSELANDPRFWRVAYTMGRAYQSAMDEGPDGPAAAHLEGGAGARPGGGQQVDLGEQIVSGGARRGASVLP